VYEDRGALQLVKGKLVKNAHVVEVEEATPEAFEDERMQYAFRHQAGDFFANRKKMGVALFNVYMPEFVVNKHVGVR
jgi:hypothetical protein